MHFALIFCLRLREIDAFCAYSAISLLRECLRIKRKTLERDLEQAGREAGRPAR